MKSIWEVRWCGEYLFIYGRRGTIAYRGMTIIDAIADYIRRK